MLHHAGIALVSIGIVIVAGNIGSSLFRAKRRDVTWAAVATALAFLVSTLALGVVLLHNLHTGFLADARLRVLAIHLHIALAGWALVMMVGVSHRLLPMFLLAHGADTRWTRRALLLITAGLLALVAGLAMQVSPLAWVGTALLDGGIACFVWQAFSFYRVRVRRKIDIGMRFAAVALGCLTVAAVLGPALLERGPAQPRRATASSGVALLGGIVLYIIGFFYKIVPLLAWTVRYRDRMGNGTAPTVADTFSARVAQVQLVVMTLGVAVLATGIGAGSAHVTRCGAVLFLAGVVLFLGQIIRVTLGGSHA
jgi:hypothetical protein